MRFKELFNRSRSKDRRRINNLEILLYTLINELGYAVTIDDIDLKHAYPDIVKKPEEEDE